MSTSVRIPLYILSNLLVLHGEQFFSGGCFDTPATTTVNPTITPKETADSIFDVKTDETI